MTCHGQVYRDPIHHTQLSLELNEFRRQGLLCDVTIRVKDGAFPCHRNVLAISCSYFKAMFTSGFKEREQSEIELPEITYAALHSILEFFYEGELVVDCDIVCDIYRAAHLLNCHNVLGYCREFLLENVTADTWLHYRDLSETFSLQDIKQAVKKYISEDFVEASQVDAFYQLTLEELQSLLHLDNLRCCKEKHIFQTAHQWLQHNPEYKGSEELVIQYVRFATMSKDDIVEVQTVSYMQLNSKCKEQLQSALNFIDCGLPTTSGIQSTPRGKRCLVSFGGASKYSFKCNFYHYLNNVTAFSIPDINNEPGMSIVQPVSLPTMPISVAFSTAACLNNSVYVIGGEIFTGDDPYSKDRSRKASVSSVFRFNCLDRQWGEMTPMNTARSRHITSLIGEYILVAGGENGRISLASVECYSLVSNTWLELQDFPHAMSDAASCVVNNILYVSGGECKHNQGHTLMYDHIHSYDSDQHTWTMEYNMSRARSGHIMYANKHCLYIIGGGVSNVDVYNTITKQMQVIHMSKDELSVTYPASGMVDDKIVVCGGFNTGYDDGIHIFDTRVNTYKTLSDRLRERFCGASSVILTIPWGLLEVQEEHLEK